MSETTGDGFIATGEGAGLGVIVLGSDVDDVCRRLADEGFTAYAPAVIDAAVQFLLDHPAVRGHGVGVVAYDMATTAALALAAANGDLVRAVVLFSGVPDVNPRWDRIQAAVEGHFAVADADADAEALSQLEQHVDDLRLFTYPDPADPDAERQAWVRTLEFLRAKLG